MDSSDEARHRGLLGAVLFVSIAMLSILLLRFRPTELPPSASALPPLIVEVQGEVKHPGVYLMEGPSATVGEAVRAAGGADKEGAAIPEGPGLQELQTGHLVRIGIQASNEVQVRVELMGAAARLTLGQKLDINTASREELCLVPQMKSDFAAAVVERRRREAWTNLNDLRVIPGVGPKTVEKWKDYLEAGK